MNILVANDYSCKITDFGISRMVESESKKTMKQLTIIGTPKWKAPEVRNCENYGYPADIYSLGMVLYEIFERKETVFSDEKRQLVFPKSYKVYIP